jgi:hypothetical protein
MEEFLFDQLTKRLSRRLTRLAALRGLVLGAIASLTGLSLFGEEAEAKKHGKKRRKKKLVCGCTTAGCTQQKVQKPSKFVNQNPTCNRVGVCPTPNPCAATVVPLPPQSPPTTTTPGPVCQTIAQCTGGRVCVSGRCEDCTSFTQCPTVPVQGANVQQACLDGRCRGGEACQNEPECFGVLECLNPGFDGATTEFCLFDQPGGDCAATSNCGTGPVCILGYCAVTCNPGDNCAGQCAGGVNCTCQGGACLPAEFTNHRIKA